MRHGTQHWQILLPHFSLDLGQHLIKLIFPIESQSQEPIIPIPTVYYDFIEGPDLDLQQSVVLGLVANQMIFTVFSTLHGNEIWISGGTPQSTRLLLVR